MNSPNPMINEISLPKEKRRWLSKTLCILFLAVSVILFFAAKWYIAKFGDVGFDSILSTLGNLKGAPTTDIVANVSLRIVIPSVLVLFVFIFVLFFFPKNKSFSITIKNKTFNILPIKHWCSVVISVVLALLLLLNAASTSGLTRYVHSMVAKSEIFEEKYVDPMSAGLEFPEEKRNLIYIFLESMETTYFSKEEGGALEYNIIPELYDLAEENISFSHNDGIGGLYAPNGASWTIAAMTAHTSGVPLKAPPTFEQNNYGKDEFLPGINNLADVLSANGYYQSLMVGSDSGFANRDVYYKQHGTDKIYDLYTAQKSGILPSEDYKVWWGMEDKYLFDYAKRELKEISKGDKPFAFTMLTVDTHFENGYVCSKCGKKYEEQYENVMSCSSKQVYEFVEWLKKQDFYENTTIVIAGDHLTMDARYIGRNVSPDYDRRVYNCILNSAVSGTNYKNREATTFDMFPTTLAAIGVKIPGERLGLGTNLFSNKKTLAEEMGYFDFNTQIAMNSEYYNKNFLK